MTDWNDIIKRLNNAHLYSIKQGKDYLEVYSSGLQSEPRLKICREVCGDGFQIDWFPNEEFIIIKKL